MSRIKNIFLFIKKYWIILSGVVSLLLLLFIKLSSTSKDDLKDKVKDQKKKNKETIKEIDNQIKKNKEAINQAKNTVNKVNNKNKTILKNKKNRDDKADDIFNKG